MKNQYFADINDYRKYGILKSFCDLKIFVCWMLTKNDGRTDGNFIKYISRQSTYRQFDPLLFDALDLSISSGNRNTQFCEKQLLIPGAGYYNTVLTDSLIERQTYFSFLFDAIKQYQLVFLDPDNGLEVKSVRKGSKDSSKYIYYDEVDSIYKQGCSLLIYQHFIRENRAHFIKRISSMLKEITASPEILILRTPRVVFFLLPQPDRINYFKASVLRINSNWENEISCSLQ